MQCLCVHSAMCNCSVIVLCVIMCTHTSEITIYYILMSCWVISNFQIAEKVEHPFICLLDIRIFFFFDMCIDFFASHFCCIVAFFLLLCRATLKVLDIIPLIYTLQLSFCTELFAFRLSL